MTKGQKNITSDMELSANDAPPKVLMLMGTHCAFCGPMMQMLTELMKAGHMAELQIVNIEQNPEYAARLGVRSVPWVRIGAFDLEGAHSKAEYQRWLKLAQQPEGVRDYMEAMLGDGQVSKVIKLIKQDHNLMRWIFELMRDPDAKINLRLGIGVIMEEFAATPWFQPFIPELEKLCRHEDARVRADACHNLALTENRELLPILKNMLDDTSEEVREVAADGIESLQAG